jgi:uncharacterized protein YccT (UPF0319 family)
MALTTQQIADIQAAFPQLANLANADLQTRAAADLTTLKNTGAQIVTQVQALAAQATSMATAYPASATEINAVKAAFVAALKSALGL